MYISASLLEHAPELAIYLFKRMSSDFTFGFAGTAGFAVLAAAGVSETFLGF